ncbi:MAG: hypothetical protein GWN00_26950 [Aliifodinibius sp.]|nr:hypothetical protein [Fodinibius sp.]NIV14472.1 hypothetical protein [Fodinibius sp.]NIY28310.1 hypothetical protein [Fodinibius sp.]
MSILEETKSLFAHMFWADATVWESVFDLSDYQTNQKLKQLLHHIHSVQHAYLLLWLGKELNIPELNSFKRFQEISDWGLTFYLELENYLDDIIESHLYQLISIPWSEHLAKKIGKPPEQPNLLQMMNQVILHSGYHRAQANKMIREMGGEPPLVDFIMWIWLGKPDAKWPTQ